MPNLPSLSPGTKMLPKYEMDGNVKQLKYYDGYGREIIRVDLTDHGRQGHTSLHWHKRIYNNKYPEGRGIDHRADPNIPIDYSKDLK